VNFLLHAKIEKSRGFIAEKHGFTPPKPSRISSAENILASACFVAYL
jgi:hypothetical protein